MPFKVDWVTVLYFSVRSSRSSGHLDFQESVGVGDYISLCYKCYEIVSLKPTSVKLRPYGEDNPEPIPLAGSFFGVINTPSGQMDLTRFMVLKARNAGSPADSGNLNPARNVAYWCFYHY